MALPLTETLRPGRLTDVCGQSEIIEALIALDEKSLRPHLLFHGQPGIGKSSILRCLEKNKTTLIFRECDERLSESMRTRLKHFMSVTSRLPKLIAIEAVDKLTKSCQSTLRDIMEDPLHVVQVVMTANDVSNILPAVLSRSLRLRLHPIPVDDICSYLQKLDHNSTSEQISEICDGDLRTAIHMQQANVSLSQEVLDIELVCQQGKSAMRNWVIERTSV